VEDPRTTPTLPGDVVPATAFYSGSAAAGCDADRPTQKDALPAQVFLDGLHGKQLKKMWVIPSRIAIKQRRNYIWAKVRGVGQEVWPKPEWHTPASAIRDTGFKSLNHAKDYITVFPAGGDTQGISLKSYLRANDLLKRKNEKGKLM
jgi:hypothetical protein